MYERELEIAVRAAIEAGKILKDRVDINVLSSEGKDLKLSSDKLSEKTIIHMLSESGIPILTEESGVLGTLGDTYWIVDPIDGTVNYLRNLMELSCVSIALWDGGKPVLGVVNRYACDELYTGLTGVGAWKNNTEIHCNQRVNALNKAVLATGFPVFRNYSTDCLSDFIQKIQLFKKIRMLGSAALMGTFIADGRVDAYMEDEIMLWDVAAAVAIVEAAGGTTELELLDNHKTNCRCFANGELMEDYHAKVV